MADFKTISSPTPRQAIQRLGPRPGLLPAVAPPERSPRPPRPCPIPEGRLMNRQAVPATGRRDGRHGDGLRADPPALLGPGAPPVSEEGDRHEDRDRDAPIHVRRLLRSGAPAGKRTRRLRRPERGPPR